MSKHTIALSLAALPALCLIAGLPRPAHADAGGAGEADSAPAVRDAASPEHEVASPGSPWGIRLSAAAGAGWFAAADGAGDGHAGVGTGIALAADIRASPHLGLGADLTLVASDGFRQRTGIQAFGVNIWPTDRVWLRAGLGFGFSSADAIDDVFNRQGLAPAALLAAGVELLRRTDWSLGLQARAAAITYDSGPIATGGVLLGVAWR